MNTFIDIINKSKSIINLKIKRENEWMNSEIRYLIKH